MSLLAIFIVTTPSQGTELLPHLSTLFSLSDPSSPPVKCQLRDVTLPQSTCSPVHPGKTVTVPGLMTHLFFPTSHLGAGIPAPCTCPSSLPTAPPNPRNLKWRVLITSPPSSLSPRLAWRLLTLVGVLFLCSCGLSANNPVSLTFPCPTPPRRMC